MCWGMTLDAVVGAVTRAPLLAGGIELVPITTHVLLCGWHCVGIVYWGMMLDAMVGAVTRASTPACR